jgi:hypothetical protein
MSSTQSETASARPARLRPVGLVETAAAVNWSETRTAPPERHHDGDCCGECSKRRQPIG